MERSWSGVIEALLRGSPAEWAGFLIAVIAIGVGIAAVNRYRASLRGDADPAAADAVLIRHVRELRDRGEVSEEEFRSLKGRLRQPGAGIVSARNDADRNGGSPS